MSSAHATAPRTVVVTGAGNGLGAAIAVGAATAGWRVGVLDLDGAAAARTATDIGPASPGSAVASSSRRASAAATTSTHSRDAGAGPGSRRW